MLHIGFYDLTLRAAFRTVTGKPVHFGFGDSLFITHFDAAIITIMHLIEKLPLGDLVLLEIGVTLLALFAKLHVKALLSDDWKKG